MKLFQGQMDEAARAALASGRAEPGIGLFIDTFLDMNGITLEAGEAVSGAMLESEAPAEMSAHALDMAFAAIERGGGQERRKDLVYPELSSVPAVLRDAILEAESQRAWGWAGPGIRKLKLGLPGGAKAEIIRLDAGATVPWHTHKGQEITLCLAGEFSDEAGVYGPGDYTLTDRTIRHQPKAHDKGAVYALAVTDAGLRFEGLLGALQRLAGQ